MKIIAMFVFIYLSLTTAAQQPHDNNNKDENKKWISHVDSLVMKIVSDTSLLITSFTDSLSGGSGKEPGPVFNALYRNNELVAIKKTTGLQLPRQLYSTMSYYFEKGKPVLMLESFDNSTRMGSCGQISVTFAHYIKDSSAVAGKAISVVHFYTCYGYQLHKPSKESIYTSLTKMMQKIQHPGKTVSLKAGRKTPLILLFSANIFAGQKYVQDSYGL